MLDDLVFKGKTLGEALAKASNFFGTDEKRLKYEELEESPDGEIWIKLVEHPQPPAAENEQADVQPEIDPQMLKFGPGKARRGSIRVGMTMAERLPTRPTVDQGLHDTAGRLRKRRSRGPQRGEKKAPGRHTPPRKVPKAPKAGRNRKNEPPEGLSGAELDAFRMVANILRRTGLHIDISVVRDQARLVFNLEGPDRSILLTKKGSVLIAIQYLINKIYFNRKEKPQKIFIDSNGYRVAREEELREIALLSAEKVRNPMNPYERRLIHLALKDDEDVTTVSRGEGFIKQVSIIPK